MQLDSTDPNPPDETTTGVETRKHLVPLVREWLSHGVSNASLRSSARIKSLYELSGGMKSPVVANVIVQLQCIMKQGTDELLAHQTLMNSVNEAIPQPRPSNLQDAVFPEVISVRQLADLPGKEQYVMLQQSLAKYDSVYSLIYEGSPSQQRAVAAIESGIHGLSFIHQITRPCSGALSTLAVTQDPFTVRITNRLARLRGDFPWLADAFFSSVRVDGSPLPPIGSVLTRLSHWQAHRSPSVQLALVHGDPHIANLMARRRGKSESARWIDPNPTVGFSDPAYDWGKLLHFAEQVGWAKLSATAVRVRIDRQPGELTITTGLASHDPDSERVRSHIESLIRQHALKHLAEQPEYEAALELAIASAHVGYASITPEQGANAELVNLINHSRAYALAATLRCLARFNRLVS